MTKTHNNKQRLRSLLVTAVAVMLSFVLLFTVACGTTESNNNSSTNKTDVQKITNGNFEFYDDNDGKNLIITPGSWTKSVGSDGNGNSASSSTTASGIVDTEKSAWDSLTKSALEDGTELDIKKAAQLWDSMSAFDRLQFYDEFDIDSTDDFADYVAYNIDKDDIPACANPGTHSYDASSAPDEDSDVETHVLMLHNYRSDKNGTAQKYTSSTTVTLAANTAAYFSVWVKTADMSFNGSESNLVNGNRGAYIGVTHTVGGNTLDQMQIKNIDTSAVTENNGWVEYTVYLKACTYATSTFTIVLGLGQGGGSDKYAYVQGYAFFDDVTCKTISLADYEEATSGNVPTCSLFSNADEKLFAVGNGETYQNDRTFALDLYRGFQAMNLNGSMQIGLTEEKKGDTVYVTSPSAGKEVYKNLNIPTDNDVVTLTTLGAIQNADDSNPYLKKVSEDFETLPFADNTQTLLLMSADGAPYTAKYSDADMFTLQADEYLLISFWVKTSAMNGFTGATITLKDGENNSAIGAFDSTTLDTVDIDDKEDLYNGWKQCFFFVKNETSSVKEFYLEFNYGSTTIVGTSASSYIDGYAAFTNFEFYPMTEEEFDYTVSGDYAVSVSLYGNYTSDTSTAGFDDVIYSGEEMIQDGAATPKNYTGVEGGSSYVVAEGDYCLANNNPNAGLINKNYFENYQANNCAWLNLVATAENMSYTEVLANWNALMGTTQPLLIANVTELAYGYIANSNSSISASGYTAVSVRVKVSAGAVAYVYLIDTSDPEKGYGSVLSLETPGLTYWYNDDGDVCKTDPASDDYDEKTDVVYYLVEGTNLYEQKDAAGVYYANLANYTADEDGNLIASDKDETIVYYYHDGKYYANYDESKDSYSVEVRDFDHSIARYDYTAENAVQKELYVVVDGRNPDVAGKWVTVTFNVHTGNEAKSYRLEVWSGSRDGSVTGAVGSYVVFDKSTPSSLSNNYSDLLSDAITAICDETEASGGELPEDFNKEDLTWYSGAVYHTFSWYDSPEYVRYDEDKDEDEVGNKNQGYLQSEQQETLIYLYYEDTVSNANELTYSVFADFSTVDADYAADISDSDDDHDHDNESSPTYEVGLLVTSLVFSVLLLIALIIVIVRYSFVKLHKKAASSEVSKYSSKRKHFKVKSDEEETTEPEVQSATEETPEEEKDENDPYEE